MWPAVKQPFTQEQFRVYVNSMVWNRWRPSRVVWHNTGAPSLAQWIKSARDDAAKGLTPGMSRIRSLENFFKSNQGWSGCPHLFIANDFIWVMNRLDSAGVHSPSFNSTAIGIEMIGDFSTEDDDAGVGLAVKNNTIFATAMLCEALGLEPTDGQRVGGAFTGTIFLHKQDPRTTHDCPGKDIAQDKAAMIHAVAALMGGGEHEPGKTGDVIAGKDVPTDTHLAFYEVLENDLNVREGAGVNNKSIVQVNRGDILSGLGSAQNGTTSWVKVKTSSGAVGWVAGRFVQQKEKEA